MKFVDKIIKTMKRLLGVQSPSDIGMKGCSFCRKHGTIECPNSFYCYSTDDKPYFEPR